MTREAYDQVINAPHKAKLSHELIAAAASYEAMKAWNQHRERNGDQVDHAMMKQFMAAAAGAFIDRMIETKGLDSIDRHRARQHAEEHHNNFVDQYQNQYQNPYQNQYQSQYQSPYPNQYQNPYQNQYENPYQNQYQYENPYENQYQYENQHHQHHQHHHHHHRHGY